MAASATFALKPGVWFRRGRLVMVSPDSRGTACPLSGRNSTYRPVQISGTGSIVSSGTGRYIHPSTIYSGTKHAISAIAESLRREIGKDWIRVTSVEPGAVKTELTSHMREDARQSVEQRLGDMEQ